MKTHENRGFTPLQASLAEIEEGLVALDAIEVDGKWCVVDHALLMENCGAVLDIIAGVSLRSLCRGGETFVVLASSHTMPVTHTQSTTCRWTPSR